jgi:hypothetical protein
VRDRLALLPLEVDDAEHLLASVPQASRGECWWLVLRDGTPVPGNRGAGALLYIELDLTRPVGRVLRALRLSSLVDAVDELLAHHRTVLGRLVPDGPAPRRYP